jgi:hypothetical protein
VAVRLRRDFGTVLALIRAHAVLHQCSRKRDEAGRIIADLDDYAEVHRVVADVVAEGVAATVSPTMRETVIAVQLLTQGDEAPHPDGAMAQHVALELRLDKSAARRRLLAASIAGYVTNAEDRRGKPGRWKPGEPLPVAVVVLPVADLLPPQSRAKLLVNRPIRRPVARWHGGTRIYGRKRRDGSGRAVRPWPGRGVVVAVTANWPSDCCMPPPPPSAPGQDGPPRIR